MNDPYAAFAAIYDDWQRQFHPPYWKYALGRTRPLLARAETALDLACGTGAWSIPAARAGVRVFAVDGSRAMLDELHRKRGRLTITLLHSPLHRFRLPQRVDLAVCFFDSLNHLIRPEHLHRSLAAVAGSLKPGAWFVFDLNNEHSFHDLWRGQFITHAPQYSVNISSQYDDRTRLARSEIVIFRSAAYGQRNRRNSNDSAPANARPPNRWFVKTRSVVRERFYSDDEICGALRRVGFEQIEQEAISPFPEISTAPLKTWWQCKRP